MEATGESVLLPEYRFEQEEGAVAGHFEEATLGQFDLLGIVHDVDHFQPVALVEIMILLALEDEDVTCDYREFASVEPMEGGAAGYEDEFVKVVGVLNLGKIVLVRGFA